MAETRKAFVDVAETREDHPVVMDAAKSLEGAIQFQSDYSKSAYAEFVTYLVKAAAKVGGAKA
jgi:hypothetical protein